MFELQLIGYTAELGHLVLDLDGGRAGRYRLRVDADLFATLDELRERRRAAGLPVGDLVEFADELGLSREQLQRLDDADARAAAAAGQVSTGSAAAEEWLAVPREPPTWDEAVDREEPPDGTRDAPLEEPGDADGETGPTVLPGWEAEDDHDHAEGDPVVFEAERPTVVPSPPSPPEPERPVSPPEPAPARGLGDGDDASVRIVPGPSTPSRPAPDESDGLVARALESHGLTAPEPDRDTPSWVDDAGGPNAAPEPEPEDEPEPEPEPEVPTGPERVDDAPAPIAVPEPASGRTPPRPLVATPADRQGVGPVRERPAAPEAEPRPEPVLSPAEIQARLRSGRSVRAVAKAAGVDQERIRRWEVPIVAERARILGQAHALRLERPRLGRSSRPLGEAVRRNLTDRGVDQADIAWETSRRRDGRWRVCVRYVSRGRKRSATWTYDPEAGELRAASDAARELGFTRRQRR